MEQKGEAVSVEELEKEVEIMLEENQSNEERKVEYAFVLNDFFKQDFLDPEEVLDKNKGKAARETRVYVCLKLEYENNTFLIPLRRDLAGMPGHPLFQKACYPVPSENKPDAGLDFRKIIVVNEPSLYRIDEAKISAKQRNTMQDNFEVIKNLAIDYIDGFKKAARKNRQKREPLYKYSALNNFLEELGIK
ncbi:hypothetical protein E2K98_28785 [Bacillus salipaludis]|uniref:Uncharacterized protein n=1 Tax=Bacillus salipaludis TaxID=2547811 RepID=A0A4R5VII5_9BACI|nr:hypothetical protein [Bacillus salipaludis]TDK54768.1 hypothetical protein E2K98_28785 [Bacillus salipaludis]